MKSVQLVFQCSGLQCSPSSSFQTGILSGLLIRAKNQAIANVERRSISIALSSNSGEFLDVYRSETMEDSPDISPSLVAEITYASGGDTFMKVKILYSSTATGGKDIVLCETMLSLNEIASGRLSKVSLTSAYLKSNALLTVNVVDPFRPLLQESSFAPIAKTNSGNPYKQSYVFRHEDVASPRSVYCEEYGLETRLSVKMVVAFLDETIRALNISRDAWAARKDLETIRQGQFVCLSNALKHGWQQVTISVLEVRIADKNDPSSAGRLVPTPDDDDDDVTEDKNGNRKGLATRGLRKAISTFGAVSGVKRRSYDETKPSTFVEISLSDRGSIFSDPIGCTNTEYCSHHPVYGSNLNAGLIKNPQTEHRSGGEGVSIVTERKAYLFGDESSPQGGREPTVTVEGKAVQFVRFVPSCIGAEVSFTLNQMVGEAGHRGHDGGDEVRAEGLGDAYKRLAQCSVSLDCPELSLPASHHDSSSGYPRRMTNKWVRTADQSVDFHVTVEVVCPNSSDRSRDTGTVSAAKSASMPSVSQRRSTDHSVSLAPSDVLRDCREYEYQLGRDAQDPLSVIDLTALPLSSSDSMTTAATVPFADDFDLLSFGDDPELARSAASKSTTQDTHSDENNTDNGPGVLRRLDYHYPLSWLENHILRIKNLITEVTTARSNAKELLLTGAVLRPSTAKKIMTQQAVPVNLHMQVIAVRDSLQRSKGDTTPGMEGVLDAITCGCLSPHGLGFLQKKGLDAMEGSLGAARMRIDVLKTRFHEALEKAKFKISTSDDSTSLSVLSQESSSTVDFLNSAKYPAVDEIASKEKAAPVTLSRKGAAFKLYDEIGKEVLEYETAVAAACRRKVYAISQAISIAVSAVLMKLTLVAEKHIPPEVGEGWLTHGFLLVFEGLLSVIGNEKFMLEDTMSAVDAISQYQIRILPTSMKKDEKDNEKKEKNKTDLHDIILFEADNIGGKEDDSTDRADVGMRGREILLYLPQDALNALPGEYQRRANDGGAVMKLVAVLFSQGIDIQQTLALAATSLSAMANQVDAKAKATKQSAPQGEKETGEDQTANNLQYVVNVRGLALLEEYCFQYRPIEGDQDPSFTGAEYTGSAAALAKEQHDKYRSSIPSPTHAQQKKPSRVASTSRNISMAINLTSAATSAARSAVWAYGASYVKSSGDSEKSHRALGGTNSPVPLASHPLLEELTETILASTNINSKNVDMLVAVERVCVMLGGCRVTFCKSGKDRTGMAVTYEQSRQLGERFGCGQSTQRVLRDANVMRIHGVRILIAEKNIGRRVYSINKLQAQFLPAVYRPPKEVLEDLLRKDDT